MRIHTSDKLIAYLALISGLSISAVAIYYSVAGLMAIFAAALIPIMIMGIVLEIGKLSATVWLKQNWTRAPRFLKTYLLLAILSLMLLTSMGIFGYLSKAHLDQAVPTGDVAAKVALLDEKIKTERDNIETARTALKQMDAQVDARLSRSDDEKGAERAVQIRRQQQAERGRLQKDIADAQARIAKLNEERAPIASELRKVEAEVGPIKYIAALIYGDNPDGDLLERAVRWVIIVIVLVFDPLAVILLLASQYSFNWFRQQQENPQEQQQIEDEPLDNEEMASDVLELEKATKHDWPMPSSLWPFPSSVGKKESNVFEVIKQNEKVQEAPYQPGYEDVAIKDDAGMNSDGTIPHTPNLESVNNDPLFDERKPLEDWNEMIAEAERAVVEEKEKEDHEIIEHAAETEKQAMKQWKHDNPEGSLKLQKKLLERGVIKTLPWEEYLKPQADFTTDEAAVEAKKWADENPQTEEAEKAKEWADERIGLDERPGDYLPNKEVVWMEHDENGNQIKKTTYQQNAEQNERTIWQRIQDAKK